MKAESPASPFRLVIGDILILLALLLTADVLIVMPKKIHAVVLKADYQEIFRYELIICAVLLLFALDVRFNLFTRSGHTGLRVAGWVLRIAVVLFTLVIAFFCGKVIRGGLINTAGPADRVCRLRRPWDNRNAAPEGAAFFVCYGVFTSVGVRREEDRRGLRDRRHRAGDPSPACPCRTASRTSA